MHGRLFLILFNAYFYLLFFLSFVTCIPLFTLYVASTRLFTSQRATMRRFRRAMVCWGRIVALLPFPFIRLRYELQGENDTGRSFIFVCNHRSTVDAFLMGVLPHEFVEIVNRWPFKIPVLGIYARLAAFLDIRSMTPEAFMNKATSLLDEGVSIIFFPEGTRSRGRAMGSFHSSAFRLALESGRPLVPLCISGSDIVMPKGASLLRPGTIVVRQLLPVTPDQYVGLTPFALKKHVWDLMDRELSLMEGAG